MMMIMIVMVLMLIIIIGLRLAVFIDYGCVGVDVALHVDSCFLG